MKAIEGTCSPEESTKARKLFKIYFENKILINENFDHPEKNELFCLQTNLFVKNSFYMTIIFAFLEVWMSCFIPKNRYGFSFSCDGAV